MRNKLPAGCRENWKFFILHLGTPHEVIKFSVYFTASACVICQCRSSHWSLPLLNISRPFRQFFLWLIIGKTGESKKGFALGLVLKVRVFVTRKWPIRARTSLGKWSEKYANSLRVWFQRKFFQLNFTKHQRVKTIGWLEMPVRLIR